MSDSVRSSLFSLKEALVNRHKDLEHGVDRLDEDCDGYLSATDFGRAASRLSLSCSQKDIR